MAGSTDIKLCILWENELRTSSRLIRQAEDFYRDNPENIEKYSELANMAYAACAIALYGLTDEHAAVLVATNEIRQSYQETV